MSSAGIPSAKIYLHVAFIYSYCNFFFGFFNHLLCQHGCRKQDFVGQGPFLCVSRNFWMLVSFILAFKRITC